METAALVALLRVGGRAWANYVLAARQRGAERVSALAVLEQELGLLSYEALDDAERDIAQWQARGLQVLPFSAPDYPENLRVVASRPPLLFVAGRMTASDRQAVSLIGTREPSDPGRSMARATAVALARAGITVVSGLAAGIDAVAHRAVLELRAAAPEVRTLAVVGTGLDNVYPPEHAQLQAQVAEHGAVLSQFWPDATATKGSFPARNALMAGLTLGSVIVEAGERSGTRIQARHALEQGRMVVLMPPVMRNEWAVALAAQPGVLVARDAADVVRIFKR